MGIQTIVDEPDYQQIVAQYHESLFRFALSLSGARDEAADLTQETYARLLSKGWQLRDAAKTKAWMFTTLYRIFLGGKRRRLRFPHVEIVEAEHELPAIDASVIERMDAETVMSCLLELEEHFRAPITLFLYAAALLSRDRCNSRCPGRDGDVAVGAGEAVAKTKTFPGEREAFHFSHA